MRTSLNLAQLLRQLTTLAISVMIIGLTEGAEFAAYGQGGSPIQADFADAPVPPGPQVNEFTGDFTYGLPVLTVPGPDGAGYSLTLSYHSGADPNADVSWVGYGWSLNAGAIVREKRGFADDWQGEVTMFTKVPLDYTISEETNLSGEIGSGDLLKLPILDQLHLTAGIGATFRYNSSTGYGDIWGLNSGVSLLGNYAGMNYINDNGEGSFSGVISPNILGTVVGLTQDGLKEEDDVWDVARKMTIKRIANSAGYPITIGGPTQSFAPPTSIAFFGKSTNISGQSGVSGTPSIFIGGEWGYNANITTIKPMDRQQFHAIGFKLSAAADSSDTALMDYFYERDIPFLRDDELLPIPFANNDNYYVVGGGAFRLYNRGIESFRQNSTASSIDIENGGLSFGGGAFGQFYGGRYGWGSIRYSSESWENDSIDSMHTWMDDGDEPWFFRYYSDGGGSLLYDKNDDPIKPMIVGTGFWDLVETLGINDANYTPALPNDVRLQLNDWERPLRNGYIGYSTNAEMLLLQNDHYYHSYTKESDTRSFVLDRASMPDGIGEFSLYGSGNARMTYGLPVYARDETSVQLGIGDLVNTPNNRKHNFLAYKATDATSASPALGQYIADAYASMYLLTSVTTPNYVDRTGDGPTNDDLGGWTKLSYQRAKGNNTKNGSHFGWHYWRSPYNGLYFHQGDLSDPDDDLGVLSDGFRETYYLQKIETKTHVALFYLNELLPTTMRFDGYPPSRTSAKEVAGDSTATTALRDAFDNPATNPVRYLDHIELYTRTPEGEPDSLISRTYFQYDYTLRPNMPNSLSVLPADTSRYGMLTLKKVWTESANVHDASIHPFIFGYQYKQSNDYSAKVRSRYPEITGFADSLTADDQNPPYDPYVFDAWGNYRPSMKQQHDDRTMSIRQYDTLKWDPAAWQLKWIRSPLGGEIHVQYEEDDYSFVQDKPVKVLARLKNAASEFDEIESFDNSNSSETYLDLAYLGVDSTDIISVAELATALRKQCSAEEKTYFRYFYTLSNSAPNWTTPEWNSAYIDGYADIKSISIDTFSTGASTFYGISVLLQGMKTDSSGVQQFGTPKRICWDLVKKRKRGKLGEDQGVPFSTDYTSMHYNLVSKINYFLFDEDDHCADVDFDHSYLQIPLIGAKRGGGLRVKRLLSYDLGIEGDSALFGTEYRYEVFDQDLGHTISSGVASNEPISMREENPLISFVARDDKDLVHGKVIAGRDIARNEGQLGEALLPSASVGYSRVAQFPIHQGLSTSGFVVSDFFTYRDFPTNGRYPNLGSAQSHSRIEGSDYETNPLASNLIFYRQNEYMLRKTQGYRFILTDMNGRSRRMFTNGGIYTPEQDLWSISASVEYEYFTPGDSIPLLYYPGDSIRYGWPGKTMEVIQANRKNGSYLHDNKIEADVSFFGIVLTGFSGMYYHNVNVSELSTCVTNKIVNYPAILKSIKSYADGNYEFQENIAFNPWTGEVELSRTRDAFDGMELEQESVSHEGAYVGLSFAARDIYPEFQSVATNERARIISTTGSEIQKDTGASYLDTYLEFPDGTESTWLSKLSKGDLIEITATDGSDAGRYHVDHIDGRRVSLQGAGAFNNTDYAAYEVVGSVNVEVIRSGRLNIPGASLGGVVTYGLTDEEIANGSYMGWDGPGASDRLAFVALLNSALDSYGGTVDSTNAPSSLEFIHPISESCGTLSSLSLEFDIDTVSGGDTILLTASSTSGNIPIALLNYGQGGRFGLNDAGQVIFRPLDNLRALHVNRSGVSPAQRIETIKFCGDNVAYRTVDNVIQAGAMVVNDTNDSKDLGGGSGLGWQKGQYNAFERGKRGRWSPRVAYSYRTSVIGGSSATTGERVYKSAGVFSDFSLFNWSDPALSDYSHWHRGDSITELDRNNMSTTSVSPLGITSTIRSITLPTEVTVSEQVAWNAESGTFGFDSYELAAVGGILGDVTDARAHTGHQSIGIQSSNTSNANIRIVVNNHVSAKGIVVRYWVSPDTTGLRVTSSATSYEWIPTYIARSGEWILLEQFIPGDSLDLYKYEDGGDSVVVLAFANNGSDSVYIDDVKYQPSDAASTIMVSNPEDLKAFAVVNDANFGVYPVYDGRGIGGRANVETSRGRQTFVDAHVHLARATRDWDGIGAPWSGTQFLGSPSQLNIKTLRPNGSDQSEGFEFNALNLHIGTDGVGIQTFGVSPEEFANFLKMRSDELGELTSEQLQLVDHYSTLQREYAQLEQQLERAKTDVDKRRITQEIEALKLQQSQLMQEAGIDQSLIEQ